VQHENFKQKVTVLLTCLPAEVELQVQLMQVPEHLTAAAQQQEQEHNQQRAMVNNGQKSGVAAYEAAKEMRWRHSQQQPRGCCCKIEPDALWACSSIVAVSCNCILAHMRTMRRQRPKKLWLQCLSQSATAAPA
jgi:hypothetical protein